MRKNHEFSPTPAMELYAHQRAKAGESASISSIAAKIGITRETASRWQNLVGFKEWLEERVLVYRTPILEMLEQVAIARLDDYRYWEAMALKFGYISKEKESEKPATPGVQLTPEQLGELIKQAREAK